jgi:aryl-alcohol dehydrogenase-like predicted oxidoreductase
MSYGSKSWQEWVLEDQAEINKHLQAAYEMGIYAWDTANVYSNGASEVVVGRAIQELRIPREDLVILTKVHGAVQNGSKEAVANDYIK